MTKSPDAFRTISEVGEDLGLPQHVLRFWETRFSQIKPMKRGGGRRYYRPDDVDLLRGIQHLLYEEGYTIKGVQRLLKDNGIKYVMGSVRDEELDKNPNKSPAVIPLQNHSYFPVSPESEVDLRPENSEVGSKEVGSKQAVSVTQIMENDRQVAKGKGLFNRLVGKEVTSDGGGEALNLSTDDKKLLQTTLYDLLECKRLLDQAR